MVLEVYCDPFTLNSHKVLAGLELMGTEYHFNHVDWMKGEHKGEEYAKVSCSATVPAAVDGDLKIFESNAIMQYAADRDGKDSFYPTDLEKRARVNCWLLWEASAWFPVAYKFLIEYSVKAKLYGQPIDEQCIEEATPTFHKLAKILEDQLSETKWLVGDNVTIADIAIASCIHAHQTSNLPWEKYPNLRKWMTEGIEKIPAWQKTQAIVSKTLNLESSTNGTTHGQQDSSVQATLNYSKDLSPKLTEIYFYETEAAKDVHLPGDDPREMRIYDGWHRKNEFSIDKHGFSLSDFHTSFEQWENDEAMKREFYPDVVEFLEKSLGAKRVIAFDHTIRTKANDTKPVTDEKATTQRAPVMLVHCDYTAESGPLRVRQLLGDEAEELLKRRVAFVNVWKPVHNVVEERPLAMCDVTTAPSSDFFKLHLRYRERNGENYVMKYNNSHKWYYFPKMTPDQVILLKTYDSESDGCARFVGHSAFEDTTSPPDAKTRQSVEIRTIVFF